MAALAVCLACLAELTRQVAPDEALKDRKARLSVPAGIARGPPVLHQLHGCARTLRLRGGEKEALPCARAGRPRCLGRGNQTSVQEEGASLAPRPLQALRTSRSRGEVQRGLEPVSNCLHPDRCRTHPPRPPRTHSPSHILTVPDAECQQHTRFSQTRTASLL